MLCSDSPALGDFMRTIRIAFAISMAMQRALFLGCDNPHPAHETAQLVAKYFHGDGFSWRNQTVGANLLRSAVTFRVPKRWKGRGPTFNASHAVEEYVGARPIKLHTGPHVSVEEHQHAQLPMNRASPGCVLRIMLVPRQALLKQVPPSLRNMSGYSALHVRLGDGNMARNGWSDPTHAMALKKQWKYLDEQRILDPGFVREDPGGFLRCFASVLPGPHVVVADTERVVEEAEGLSMLTTRSLGKPAIFGMPGTFGHGEVAKVFIDWWLLANAAHVAAVGFKAGDSHGQSWSSKFTETARRWYGDNVGPPYRLACPESQSEVSSPASSRDPERDAVRLQCREGCQPRT